MVLDWFELEMILFSFFVIIILFVCFESQEMTAFNKNWDDEHRK